MPKSVIVIGSTGLVGATLVRLLAAHPGISDVICPGRRPTAPISPNHRPVQIDFEDLETVNPEIFKAETLVSAMGTTLKKAGSPEAFRHIDFDLVFQFCKKAKSYGVQRMVLVSSEGASPRSRILYLKVKGDLENAIAELGFESFQILKPSLLIGDRQESRPLERFAMQMVAPLRHLFRGPLAAHRPILATDVASAAANAVLRPVQGIQIYSGDRLDQLARL
ncbi:MAG: NAD-dependent epimerase/dehydratase family protein [Bdellovibrionales bacterium]|nr:NAD-dependent epimerase/dehydratase family protein [Bdellovibrionales bacterium]